MSGGNSGEVVFRFVSGAPAVIVLVAGDCMLDTYVSGVVSRISAEAPVPVVSVTHRRYVAGGAANVASNVRSMGAKASLAGVTGADEAAVRLRGELLRAGVDCAALLEDAGRMTTTKTRITAAGRQIARFDDEDRSPLPHAIADEMLRRCEVALDSVDACVVSDYGKGTLTGDFCRRLIGAATARGLPVVADPKSLDLKRFRGARVMTLNLAETAAAAGIPVDSSAALARAAKILLPRIAPSALLVTRGEDGMSIFENGAGVENGKGEFHLSAKLNEVADVTGAGDTVAGALAIALGMGMAITDAAEIANLAAGAAVSHAGTWSVTADEIIGAAGSVAVC